VQALATRLTLGLAAIFLLLNLAVRADALVSGTAALVLLLAGSGFGLVLLLRRPRWVVPVLSVFGASFFLYGFHSYRLQSQTFELLLTLVGLVLLLRLRRADSWPAVAGASPALLLLVLFALLAACSLLLLPWSVLEARAFLEGGDLGRAVLRAFPKDPLYPIAAVNRLWLFTAVAVLLAAQSDGRTLCRALVRGIAWAAVAACVLGVLDFADLLSLDRYNLSNLFYGSRYRRLQSTFGNPSWFACFVACALPLVLLEFHEARERTRLLLAAALPLLAASLILSGARAAWLAAALPVLGAVIAVVLARRRGRPTPKPDEAVRLALGLTIAVVGLLAVTVITTPAPRAPGTAPPPAARLEGLSREMHYRGLGAQSPRRVAAGYALELAKLAPVQGLAYESFNLHLLAQLEIPGSGVATLVNTATAEDSRETLFDDSHSTYLQVLAGTGAVGLVLWLALALAGMGAALRALLLGGTPEPLAVLLGLVVFHFYGLFQGMAYIPVTFFLFPLLTAYAVTLSAPAPAPRGVRIWRLVGLFVLLASAAGYSLDSGYTSLKRRFGVPAYLPDEASVFEGFYRPESGPAGEFRWMAQRGIVRVGEARPFRLVFTCEHLDVEREPVVLRLSFEGRDAGQVVFRRRGSVEHRLAFDSPGSLRLTVSRTFRPATGDRRVLGVAVSAIQWE
jgi:hypothetical protein